MKRLLGILPIVLAAAFVAAPSYAQQQDGSIAGRVIDRDGVTPVQGATLWIDSLVTNNGRIQMRERLTTKTGKDGRYSMSGLYIGRVRVTVVVNNQPVMVKGEAIGDEIFLASGRDATANFDLSKAPAAPPVTAGAPAAANSGGMSDKDREELRKKLEAEAAASGIMSKAFEEGKTAYNAKNYDEAVTKFKSAIEKIPNPPPAGVADVIWANLAKTYDAMKQWPDSVTAYKKAIEYKPTESNYYLNMSLAQIAMGNLEDSQASIAKAAELNPANAGMAYYNMGATLVNRQQYDQAITFFKKAIDLDPKYANAYYQLGLTYVSQNKMAEAGPYLSKYLELSPTGQDAETAKGLLEFVKQQSAPAPAAAPAGRGNQPARGK